MEGIIDKSTTVLLNYGVLGISFILSLFIGWRLWIALQHVQEKRFEESGKMLIALEANTRALEELKKVVEYGLAPEPAPRPRRRRT